MTELPGQARDYITTTYGVRARQALLDLRAFIALGDGLTAQGRTAFEENIYLRLSAEAIVHRATIADGELSDLEWHSIAQARSLELPNITRVVLEDLGERIAAGALHAGDFPVPFYHRRNGSFRRDLIGAGGDLA